MLLVPGVLVVAYLVTRGTVSSLQHESALDADMVQEIQVEQMLRPYSVGLRDGLGWNSRQFWESWKLG